MGIAAAVTDLSPAGGALAVALTAAVPRSGTWETALAYAIMRPLQLDPSAVSMPTSLTIKKIPDALNPCFKLAATLDRQGMIAGIQRLRGGKRP